MKLLPFLVLLMCFLASIQALALTPLKCDDNQEYRTCGSACEKTCENKDNTKPQICNASCKIGCFCNEGFVKKADGKCVEPQHC